MIIHTDFLTNAYKGFNSKKYKVTAPVNICCDTRINLKHLCFTFFLVCRTFVSNAPYVISTGEEIAVEKHWETGSLRSTALEIRGLPKGVDESNIKFYMEDKDENTEIESVSFNSEVAIVKIVDVTGKKIHANSIKIEIARYF